MLSIDIVFGKGGSYLTKRKSTTRSHSTLRRNVAIPEALYEQLRDVAEERDLTIVEVLRKFIRLGLIFNKVEQTSNEDLCVVRDGKPAERIVLV
jgi:hypothetical protein